MNEDEYAGVTAEEFLQPDVYRLREEITELRAEVARLRNIEALKDIQSGELREARDEINELRVKVVNLKSSLEGMIMDMSLMEETIRELSGKEPGPDDYGP